MGLTMRISLLFRPGHYEVLYLKEATPFSVETLNTRCSFCHEDSVLPVTELLSCFHVHCAKCLLSDGQCPNCVEFLPAGLIGSDAFGEPIAVERGVSNDEAIARALQDELMTLDVQERQFESLRRIQDLQERQFQQGNRAQGNRAQANRVQGNRGSNR